MQRRRNLVDILNIDICVSLTYLSFGENNARARAASKTRKSTEQAWQLKQFPRERHTAQSISELLHAPTHSLVIQFPGYPKAQKSHDAAGVGESLFDADWLGLKNTEK